MSGQRETGERLLEAYRGLRDRDLRREGLFIAEGRILVERLLLNGIPLHSAVCTERHEAALSALVSVRCPLLVRPKSELAALAGYPFHRGVLACGPRPESCSLESALCARGERSGIVVLCPELMDAENLGSILRSALAFGAALVAVGPRCCDPYSRRALKVSMGAALMLEVVSLSGEARAADVLRAHGYRIVAAANDAGATAVRDLAPHPRTALLLGQEATGLGAGWLQASDRVVRIPMDGRLDSLNVGVAAGIVLYELAMSLADAAASPGGASP